MRRIFIVLMMMTLSLTVSAQQNKGLVKTHSTFVKEGNRYKQTTENPNHFETTFVWEDKKGKVYPIWVNLKTGASFVKKPSPTKKNADGTPKLYNCTLPEDVCIDIARRLGLIYTPKNG